MEQPLHPNLARIAAAHAAVRANLNSGRISTSEARAQVAALVARDDQGILWSVDYATGVWMRRTRTGQLVADTPPSYGLATPTPFDVSTPASGVRNPDGQITRVPVVNELTWAPNQLAGATRMPRDVAHVAAAQRAERAGRMLLVSALAVLAVAAALLFVIA